MVAVSYDKGLFFAGPRGNLHDRHQTGKGLSGLAGVWILSTDANRETTII